MHLDSKWNTSVLNIKHDSGIIILFIVVSLYDLLKTNLGLKRNSKCRRNITVERIAYPWSFHFFFGNKIFYGFAACYEPTKNKI